MRILCSNENVVLFISEEIQFGIFENEEKWRINEYLYAIDNDYTCYECEEIPEEVQEYRYCYTEEDGFYVNPNWVEPQLPPEDRITQLEDELARQKQINLNAQADIADTDYRITCLELGIES